VAVKGGRLRGERLHEASPNDRPHGQEVRPGDAVPCTRFSVTRAGGRAGPAEPGDVPCGVRAARRAGRHPAGGEEAAGVALADRLSPAVGHPAVAGMRGRGVPRGAVQFEDPVRRGRAACRARSSSACRCRRASALRSMRSSHVACRFRILWNQVCQGCLVSGGARRCGSGRCVRGGLRRGRTLPRLRGTTKVSSTALGWVGVDHPERCIGWCEAAAVHAP
jgi:hypothetical protein